MDAGPGIRDARPAGRGRALRRHRPLRRQGSRSVGLRPATSPRPAGASRTACFIVAKTHGNIETKRASGTSSCTWNGGADQYDRLRSGPRQLGVFLASTGPGDAGYELQILDSYRNETYVNGQAGSIYKQRPPLVNPCASPASGRPTTWSGPRPLSRRRQAEVAGPRHGAYNGVLIQNDAVLTGATLYIGQPGYKAGRRRRRSSCRPTATRARRSASATSGSGTPPGAIARSASRRRPPNGSAMHRNRGRCYIGRRD